MAEGRSVWASLASRRIGRRCREAHRSFFPSSDHIRYRTSSCTLPCCNTCSMAKWRARYCQLRRCASQRRKCRGWCWPVADRHEWAAPKQHSNGTARRSCTAPLRSSRTADGPVFVVAAPRQLLPELPIGVQVVEDPVEGLGLMRGIATGLAAVADCAFRPCLSAPRTCRSCILRLSNGAQAARACD